MTLPLDPQMQKSSQAHLIASEASRLQEDAPLIRKLPDAGERVETGPVQFGDDWPGVFIRGDNAFGFLGALDQAITKFEPHTEGLDYLTACVLSGLRDTLASCILSGLPRRSAIVMGEAIENAHSAPCEACAAISASSLSNEQNTGSGASAQVQGDGK